MKMHPGHYLVNSQTNKIEYKIVGRMTTGDFAVEDIDSGALEFQVANEIAAYILIDGFLVRVYRDQSQLILSADYARRILLKM